MARSMRSKRGRKLRAFKRIRYGEKELVRLKNMLEKAAAEEKEIPQPPSTSTSESKSDAEDDVQMEVEPEKTQFSKSQELPSKPPKYPCWLSQFKVKKLAKQERKRKQKETKRLKKELKKTTRKNKKK